MKVWAFARIPDDDARQTAYDTIFEGKCRFGCWGTGDLRENQDEKLDFLLDISKGDWIVQISCPGRGNCVAVQVTGRYGFDEGFKCSWGNDFNHFIPVDPSTIIEFDRRDPAIIRTVNLNPRGRYQLIYSVKDFEKSLDNLKKNKPAPKTKATPGQELSKSDLTKIAKVIKEKYFGKEFAVLAEKICGNIENVVSVEKNRSGLIVSAELVIGHLSLQSKIMVMAKSYEKKNCPKTAVDQVQKAIEKNKCDAGIIITPAETSEAVESYIHETIEQTGKPIDLIAGDDMLKFAARYAGKL